MDLSPHIFMKFQVDLKREFIIWKAYLYSRGSNKIQIFHNWQVFISNLLNNSEKAVILKNRKYFCNRDIESF